MALLGTATFSFAGIAGHVGQGLPGRFDRKIENGEVGNLPFFDHLEATYQPCLSPPAQAQAEVWKGHQLCKQSKAGLPEVVLLGDSHAEHLFPGLAEALPGKNVAYYRQNAPLALGEPKFAGFFEALRQDPKPKTILIAQHFAIRLQDKGQFEQSTIEIVEMLIQNGNRVLLLGDVPVLSFDPARCVYDIPFGSVPACGEPRKSADLQRERYENALQSISRKLRVSYIPLDGLFCDGARCMARTSDSILYRDQNHLNLLGSRRVGRYLASVLFPE